MRAPVPAHAGPAPHPPTESHGRRQHAPADDTRVRARAAALLRRPKLWLVPTVLCGLLAFLLSLLYMGGIVNPNGELRHLPIGIVDADQGRPLPGQTTNLGTQVTRSLTADTSGKADWQPLTGAQAQDRLASGKIYGALVVPADFTTTAAALTTANATTRPTLTVLTNPGMGSLGSSLASRITQQAAQQASLAIGMQLMDSPPPRAPTPPPVSCWPTPSPSPPRWATRSATTAVWD